MKNPLRRICPKPLFAEKEHFRNKNQQQADAGGGSYFSEKV